MSEPVDTSLLSVAELSNYRRLAAEAARTGRSRPVKSMLAWMLATVALLAVSFVALAQDRDGWVDDVAGLASVVVGGLGAVRSIQSFSDANHARTQRRYDLENYLRRIRYRDRERDRARRRSGSSGGSGAPETQREMQHEWYGENSGLTWRDREMGETLGLDSDTYVSNYLEHDKD